ncbi:hypothetical protein HDV06_004777 [Boothiomyces sp. JEL0866]|nr:hypothetical protein HDV06_004777 [Boothiomyces sp. JEL0866]
MAQMKQNALNNEDYTNAELLRTKMTILQTQLMKMEDQFTCDLLQNCITKWQNEFIAISNSNLNNAQKLSSIDILHSKFHVSFGNIIKGIPLSYYDSILRAILILLPHDLPDAPKSPYGWESMMRKFAIIKSQEISEVLKASVTLVIMDIVCLAVGGSTNEHIKKETYDLTLRHIFHYLHTNENHVAEIVEFMKELNTLMDKAKKNAVKVAIIQTFERLIQPQQAVGEKQPHETMIWIEISNIYKKAKKWAGTEELQEAALHLMTIILVNSRIDFFAANIDSFINTDLCSKSKIRPYAYRCILQLLRGRYYQDTIQNFEDTVHGNYVPGRHFGFLTREPNEQSFGNVSNRLNNIADMLFFRRKAPIEDEFLDIAAAITVQIAAHSINLGAKLISQLLDTTRVDNLPIYYYIGLRALRIVLDPESGFQTFAVSRNDSEFSFVINDFPYELTPSISAIYTYMDSQIGVHVLGSNGQVIELGLDEERKKSSSGEQVQNETLMAMLSNTLSNTNLDENEDLTPLSASTGSLLRNYKSGGSINALGVHNSPAGSRSSLLFSDVISSNGNLFNSAPEPSAVAALDTVDILIPETVAKWFAAVGVEGKEIGKYVLDAPLIDKARLKKKAALKVKVDQKHAFLLLQEVIFIVQLVPTPEFIGGDFFIGTYINHFKDDIAVDVSYSLLNVFKNHPDLRIGIINGFVNYLKNTPLRDEISICSVIVVLSQLIKNWVDELTSNSDAALPPVHVEGLYRVSCKIDAMMLVLMSHASQRIRSTCLQILFNFYKIQNLYSTHGTKAREMPLAAILLNSESVIVKQAMFAFLESGNRGHKLSAAIASSIPPLTFLEVSSSQYTGLFKYYLGELAKRFSFYGRPKATRHCAKFLKLFAAPLLETTNSQASAESRALYASYAILLMAMAGVPINSEIEYVHKSHELGEAQFLLINSVRNYIPYWLTLDKSWEFKLISGSLYFLHRDVIFFFVSELMQNFNEVRHNSSVVLNSRFLDNLFSMLGAIVQHPHFELLLEDLSSVASSLTHMFADFLAFTSLALGDLGFLINGPVSRIKTSINFCIITRRLCECLNSIRRKIHRQARFEGSQVLLQEFERINLPLAQRRGFVSHMKDWYEVIRDTTSSVNGQSKLLQNVTGIDVRKIISLRTKLLKNISLAMEQIMKLGEVFLEPPLPNGLLSWMAVMESEGYRVFTPEFLYSFEDGLGTVLASSYSGVGVNSPHVFTSAVFEQILPRLDDGPHLYLFGTSRRMSFAEPYYASSHILPALTPEELDSPAFLYPDISRESAIRLRQHVGSLLFYGLYNLMSTSTKVRQHSLIFIRELLQMFNPDEEHFDVQEHLKSFNGAFYSSVGIFLKQKILDLSTTCSELFAADSGSYLWEAVRCARSIATSDKKCMLVDSKKWIMELMIPWCQYVNLGAINEDMVNAEFFRFLMDSAFDENGQKDDIVQCWGEVARSPEFGDVNAAVLMDVVVEVSAKFKNLESAALLLASNLASIQPELVSTVLAFHLSSAAFPWKNNSHKSTHSYQHTSHLAVKEYISSLHAALKIPPPESSNDYKLNCHSAAFLSSHILPQQFESFIPHLAVIINFVVIYSDGPLKGSSVTQLLEGLIHGYIAFLHSSNSAEDPAFAHILVHVRKIIGWLEMIGGSIVWVLEKDLPKTGIAKLEIPADVFFTELLAIFTAINANVPAELTEELLHWASDGYLSLNETVHAIQGLNVILLTKKEVPVKNHNPLLSRMVDQVSVLSQIELEVKNNKQSGAGWSKLPKGKLTLKSESETILKEILNYQKSLINVYAEAGTLETQSKLFWANYGLLKSPLPEFSSIITVAADNVLLFFEKIDQSKLDGAFIRPFSEKENQSCNLQRLLLPIIFTDSPVLQEKALLLLLNSWIFFPPETVDAGQTGILYTLFYFVTWMLTGLESNTPSNEVFMKMAGKMNLVLSMHLPGAMPEFVRVLESLEKFGKSSDPRNLELLAGIYSESLPSIITHFLEQFTNNMALYIGQIISVSPTHRKVGLNMAQSLWITALSKHRDLNNIGNLRALLRSIPFLSESTPESDDLILVTFDHESEVFIKELDLASQGRVEPVPELAIPTGALRDAWNWLTAELHISPSNRMFSLM